MKIEISTKNPQDGYLINCQVHAKEGDGHLFNKRVNGLITAHLDGYAIIPIDEYEKLKAMQPVSLRDAIKSAGEKK